VAVKLAILGPVRVAPTQNTKEKKFGVFWNVRGTKFFSRCSVCFVLVCLFFRWRHKNNMESAMEIERKEEHEQEDKDGAQIVEREIALKRAAKLLLPRAVKTRTGGGKEWSRRHGDDPGTTDLLPYHRKKLRALLQALLSQHDFSTAAGVVSALLGAGNVSDQRFERDFAYYWVRT
jgi:hypothetical protein